MKTTQPRQPFAAARSRAVATLLGIAMIWGFTCPIIKDATADFPISHFLSLRFGIALLALLVVSWRTLLSWSLWARGNFVWLALAFAAGAANSLGFAAQTTGLQTTTSGKAAFITGLSVVIVPLIVAVTRRRESRSGLWLPVAVSLIGLACLVGQDWTFALVVGDGWVLLSAFAFAMQTALIARLPIEIGASVLATIQTAACVLGASLLMFASAPQPQPPVVSSHVLLAAAFLGIVATAGTVIAQTWAQRHVNESETALGLCTEPAWGAFAGALLLGERYTALGVLGCALMVLAMAWPHVRPTIRQLTPA